MTVKQRWGGSKGIPDQEIIIECNWFDSDNILHAEKFYPGQLLKTEAINIPKPNYIP